jgi:hypothetical protein
MFGKKKSQIIGSETKLVSISIIYVAISFSFIVLLQYFGFLVLLFHAVMFYMNPMRSSIAETCSFNVFCGHVSFK